MKGKEARKSKLAFVENVAMKFRVKTAAQTVCLIFISVFF
jgi:hypothetical protein